MPYKPASCRGWLCVRCHPLCREQSGKISSMVLARWRAPLDVVVKLPFVYLPLSHGDPSVQSQLQKENIKLSIHHVNQSVKGE